MIDLIVRELDVVQSLVSLLNVDLFGKFWSIWLLFIHFKYLIYLHSVDSIPKSIKHGCWPKVLKILCRIARSPVGFQIICEAFAQNPDDLEGAVSLIIYGLCSKGQHFHSNPTVPT